jgi:Domain of unknown function (DUF6983)
MDQVVPLTTAPNQTMSVDLSVNNVSMLLNLNLRFNELSRYWIMDISDADNNMLLSNIPLLTGVYPAANVLGQFQYLEIGSAYVLNISNDLSRDYPADDDLGTDFILLWSDNV